MLQETSARVVNWVKRAETVSAGLPRKLPLLKLIDTAHDLLQREREFVDGLSRFFREEARKIQEQPDVEILDSKGIVEKKMLGVLAQLKRYYLWLRACRDSARSDPELRPDDGVAEAFEKTMTSIAELNNSINAMRFIIANHDAKQAPAIGEFDSVEAMIKAMDDKPVRSRRGGGHSHNKIQTAASVRRKAQETRRSKEKKNLRGTRSA